MQWSQPWLSQGKRSFRGTSCAKGLRQKRACYVWVVSLSQDGREVHGNWGKREVGEEDVLTKLLITPKMLEPPEVTFYQENTPIFSLPTKWRNSYGEVTALPITPTPPSPSPQVLSQLSSAAAHPHLGAERPDPGMLGHSGLGNGS